VFTIYSWTLEPRHGDFPKTYQLKNQLDDNDFVKYSFSKQWVTSSEINKTFTEQKIWRSLVQSTVFHCIAMHSLTRLGAHTLTQIRVRQVTASSRNSLLQIEHLQINYIIEAIVTSHANYKGEQKC